jgi:ubiquinone/menaquinone biosynthesis C-methylase UbiE
MKRFQTLPAADEEFDAAVASLVLCSVSDQDIALREIQRVLRPGGELRFYEHVISARPGWARVNDRSPMLAVATPRGRERKCNESKSQAVAARRRCSCSPTSPGSPR